MAVNLFAAPAQALNLITNGWGRVDITAGGSARRDVSIGQKFRELLLNGVTYTVAFDLRADASKTIDVAVLNSSGAVFGGLGGVGYTCAGPTASNIVIKNCTISALCSRLTQPLA